VTSRKICVDFADAGLQVVINPDMRPDTLPRLWRYKSFTYLLTYLPMDPTQSTIAAFCRRQSPGSAYTSRLSTVAELFRSPACRPGMTSRKTWRHQQN